MHKILGGNVLRAFRQAGEVAKRLRATTRPEVDEIKPEKPRRLKPHKRLEVLDQVHPLLFGEVVAKSMAAVAHAEPGGVDDELGLKRRAAGGRGQLFGGDLGELPADVVGVVVREVGRRGAGEPRGAGRRLEQGVQGRDRAVVQVGGGGPDPVERRGLVADALRC